jgi:hypothetical protein
VENRPERLCDLCVRCARKLLQTTTACAVRDNYKTTTNIEKKQKSVHFVMGQNVYQMIRLETAHPIASIRVRVGGITI